MVAIGISVVVALSDKTTINFKRNYFGLLKIGFNSGAVLFLEWSQSGIYCIFK